VRDLTTKSLLHICPLLKDNCWLQADVVPREAVAEVWRQVHGVQPVTDNAHTDVSDLVALMANTTLSEEFGGMSTADREDAVRRWLAAEDGCGAVDETVDLVLAGEDGDQ